MKSLLGVLLMLGSFVVCAATNTGTETDHDQLRQMLINIRDAVNAGEPDMLAPYLHKDYVITVMTQEIVTIDKPLAHYFQNWFTKEGAPLKGMKTAPVASILTNIYDGKFGVVYGTTTDTYELKDGRTFEIDAKWTATVIKENNQWKLLALHVGVNPINNPIINAYRKGMGFGGVLVELKRRF